MQKLKAVDSTLEAAAAAKKTDTVAFAHGKLTVNAPLPTDFAERFAVAVGTATDSNPAEVKVTGAVPARGDPNLEEVEFDAAGAVVASVASQAAEPSSKLANGALHSFLVARGSEDDGAAGDDGSAAAPSAADAAAPGQGGPQIDAAMPFGGLEPFGREDTAQDLTQDSVAQSDAMVDQLERAEVAEEKRAVFRALTRLRGAAITSFDGIARSQTGNVDDYARGNQWRQKHPVHHLADEEADVAKWAFPRDEEQS